MARNKYKKESKKRMESQKSGSKKDFNLNNLVDQEIGLTSNQMSDKNNVGYLDTKGNINKSISEFLSYLGDKKVSDMLIFNKVGYNRAFISLKKIVSEFRKASKIGDYKLVLTGFNSPNYIQNIKTQLNKSVNQVMALYEIIKGYETFIIDYLKEKPEYIEQIMKLGTDKEQLSNENDRLLYENDFLKEQNNKLSGNYVQLEKDYSNLECQINQLLTENAELKKGVKPAEKDISEKFDEYDQMVKQTGELTNQIYKNVNFLENMINAKVTNQKSAKKPVKEKSITADQNFNHGFVEDKKSEINTVDNGLYQLTKKEIKKYEGCNTFYEFLKQRISELGYNNITDYSYKVFKSGSVSRFSKSKPGEKPGMRLETYLKFKESLKVPEDVLDHFVNCQYKNNKK